MGYDEVMSKYDLDIELTFSNHVHEGWPEKIRGQKYWVLGFTTFNPNFDKTFPDEQSVMNEAIRLKEILFKITK